MTGELETEKILFADILQVSIVVKNPSYSLLLTDDDVRAPPVEL